jgi:DNA-binding transcriptional MerR regulator
MGVSNWGHEHYGASRQGDTLSRFRKLVLTQTVGQGSGRRRGSGLSKFYQVHEFAERAGITVKALHHYDRLGLLKPRRTPSGYRRYSDEDLVRLEQIVALRFLGFPLKKIRAMLNGSGLELPDALRLQRRALEEKQQLIARAIKAIEEAQAVKPDHPDAPSILKKIIEVMGMEESIASMQRYYSAEAWLKHRPYYEHWPPADWRNLYQEVEAALGEDPAGEKAQALATRWMQLRDRETGEIRMFSMECIWPGTTGNTGLQP